MVKTSIVKVEKTMGDKEEKEARKMNKRSESWNERGRKTPGRRITSKNGKRDELHYVVFTQGILIHP